MYQRPYQAPNTPWWLDVMLVAIAAMAIFVIGPVVLILALTIR